MFCLKFNMHATPWHAEVSTHNAASSPCACVYLNIDYVRRWYLQRKLSPNLHVCQTFNL